ncbi:MAG: DUF3307 domain-containing protein [Balneolaceae bacterium]
MILLKFFLAHIIGDFFLQPAAWIKDKEEKTWRSGSLFLHVLIHFGLLILIFWDLSIWQAALFIALSHYIIDAVKLSKQTETSRAFWFYTDQLLHLLILAGVWFYLENGIVIPELTNEFWILTTGLLFLTFPVSYTIQQIMSKWSGQIELDKNDSLQGAGQYIGILERLFIFISVLTGHLQTIGFLLAAKSVFRFGDLTRSKDRKLTEYILVGTLLSFIVAIAVGMLTLHFF